MDAARRRADPWAGSPRTVTVPRCSSAQGLVSPAYPLSRITLPLPSQEQMAKPLRLTSEKLTDEQRN